MLKLFEPKTKVQKSREIIRETDYRMAKYGRRGLISNFFIFSLCLISSDHFAQREPKLAIVLSAGLLLTTLVRGYFLFRIDAIYPRAPMAWRNKYFISTLMGSCWWAVIMASLTFVLHLDGIVPLMWLYTVVFFSTTAHAFSPFKRFLAIYHFIGIVPAALTTLLTGEVIGFLYAAILLMFYWILRHHSELMGDTYWGHLEANYNLKRKAETLEEEKRDTRASVQLSNEYLDLFNQRMASLIEAEPKDPKTQALAANLQDFYRILTKDWALDPRVFNVRHLVQYLVKQHQELAEKQGIEIDTAISPAMPMRLEGDATLLAKALDRIVGEAIAQSFGNLMMIEMEFTREYEESGQLLITVSIQNSVIKRKFFSPRSEQDIQPSLDMVLAKGIAETLNGSLEYGDANASSGKCISFRARMKVAELNPKLDYHRLQYKNKPLLLINANPKWLDLKRLELDTLGFNVVTQADYKKATAQLMQAINQGAAIENVVYCAPAGDELAVDFANELISHNELKYTNQYIVSSKMGRKYFLDRLISSAPTLHFVAKPSGLFEFEIAFNSVFKADDAPRSEEPPDVIWVCAEKQPIKLTGCEIKELRIHYTDDKKGAIKLLAELEPQLVVLDRCEEMTVIEITKAIREFEIDREKAQLLPIVALGSVEQQRQSLEAGVDQFISSDIIAMGDATELSYWLNGRHN